LEGISALRPTAKQYGIIRYDELGNYEEEIVGNTVRKIHYLCGGNGLAAVYIQNGGKDTLYYAHTDYQGSLIALLLPNGTVAERYAYDPWGKRRNPVNWTQTDTRTAFILNRGYTMHEHLTEFNLINMNGRVYDPLTAIFFSPDPYLQSPGNWLNYNRYGYCLNNPFLYTDPGGEFFLMAVFLGAMINTAIQGFSGNLGGMGSFWKAMGVGALSGAAGYGAGAWVGGAIKFGGFAGGALIGAGGGAAGGFVGGASNAWANGANFGDGLKSGLIGGGIGALTGGLTGGLIRGITDYSKGYDFWDGSKINKFSLGTSSTDKALAKTLAKNYNANNIAIEGNDATLQGKVLDEFNVKEGMGGLSKLTTKVPDGLGLTEGGSYMDLKTGEVVGGYTRSYSSGFSDVYIADRFVNGDIVSFRAVVGHELIHVYHNYKFLPMMTGSAYHNQSYNINTERVAYQYTYWTYMLNGRFFDAVNTYNIAHSLNYWGSYPAQYITPYQPFYKLY
jgi:RHS repeat-associated protein